MLTRLKGGNAEVKSTFPWKFCSFYHLHIGKDNNKAGMTCSSLTPMPDFILYLIYADRYVD